MLGEEGPCCLCTPHSDAHLLASSLTSWPLANGTCSALVRRYRMHTRPVLARPASILHQQTKRDGGSRLSGCLDHYLDEVVHPASWYCGWNPHCAGAVGTPRKITKRGTFYHPDAWRRPMLRLLKITQLESIGQCRTITGSQLSVCLWAWTDCFALSVGLCYSLRCNWKP